MFVRKDENKWNRGRGWPIFNNKILINIDSSHRSLVSEANYATASTYSICANLITTYQDGARKMFTLFHLKASEMMKRVSLPSPLALCNFDLIQTHSLNCCLYIVWLCWQLWICSIPLNLFLLIGKREGAGDLETFWRLFALYLPNALHLAYINLELVLYLFC